MKRVVGFDLPASCVPEPESSRMNPRGQSAPVPGSLAGKMSEKDQARKRDTSSLSGLRDRGRPPAQAGHDVERPSPGRQYDTYAHRTRAKRLHAIHEQGLLAGKSKGIGDPETGSPIPHAVYVATGHGPLTDVAECAVAVVSMDLPEPDPNYPVDRRTGQNPSGVFHRGEIPPMREAGSGAYHAASTPFSFTTPMTPRTAAGAAHFIKQATGRDVSAEQAKDIIEAHYRAKFSLDYRASAELDSTYRKALTNAPKPAKPASWMDEGVRNHSGDNLFDMDI